MNLNELRKMVKEVLQENAYDDFLKKQRAIAREQGHEDRLPHADRWGQIGEQQ